MSLLDLILRCDEAALINVLWTEDLLGELARTWFAKGVRSAAAAERICGHIRSAFVGQDISRAEYESLISGMPGTDPDDRVHSAAAASRAPVTLLTNNVRHFPKGPLAELGVTVIKPDAFFVDLAITRLVDLIAVVSEMAMSRRQPPMSVADRLDALDRAGVPKFAAQIRQALA